MNEMDLRQTEIDELLRRSMNAPVPGLPPDFERRVMREVRRRAEPLDRRGRLFLAAYAVISAVISAMVMREQGLEWGTTAAAILAPLVLVVVARAVRRAACRPAPQSST